MKTRADREPNPIRVALTQLPFVVVGAATALLLLGRCSADVSVPESTTVDVPEEGGTILSADGRFGLRFDAGAAGEVSIETIYGVEIDGLESKVYEVHLPADGVRASEAFYDASVLATPQTKVLVTVDGGVARMLPTLWDLTNERLLASGVTFARRRFAVLDVGARNGDCTSAVCSLGCIYCEEDTEGCAPRPGLCDLDGACRPTEQVQCGGGDLDGWDAPIGAGTSFVFDSLAIAPEGRGFDVDGLCGPAGCVDNALWRLGDLANDQIRQLVLGGDLRTLVELAGLDTPYRGDDPILATKVYPALDADVPAFPANDFSIPPGEDTCCEFLLDPTGLAGLPPQARSRAPASIQGGRLRTLAPVPMVFGLRAEDAPSPVRRLERTLMSARLPSALDRLDEGLIGGALAIGALAATDNPYCQTASPRCPAELVGSSMLDLAFALAGPPDLDLDGDGPECVLDTDGDGRIDRCCDGEANACAQCSTVVPPVDAADPGSCALDPRMADGYSIALEFTAVPATIVGIGD